jgi:hypothetical protein
MSDNFNSTESNPTEGQPSPSFEDAFSQMENALDALPDGAFITIRHESNEPMHVGLNEGEQGLTVRQAIDRRGLTVGNVNVYLDSNPVTMDTFVPAGSTIMIVGE